MFLTLLDLILGTTFSKVGKRRQYIVAKKAAKYASNRINQAPQRRQNQNKDVQNTEGPTQSLPITDYQIKLFNSLKNKVENMNNESLSKTKYTVLQKRRKSEDKRKFEVVEVKEEFYKIDPKFLERGDFHLIRTNMNRKIKRINNKEMLDAERDNNFNKYGKRETNKERKNRLESNKNFRNYGIKETDLQRKKRESTLSGDT